MNAFRTSTLHDRRDGRLQPPALHFFHGVNIPAAYPRQPWISPVFITFLWQVICTNLLRKIQSKTGEKIMQDLQTWQIAAIVIAGLVVLAAIAFLISNRRRSRHLREHFGPEYNRTIAETGS